MSRKSKRDRVAAPEPRSSELGVAQRVDFFRWERRARSPTTRGRSDSLVRRFTHTQTSGLHLSATGLAFESKQRIT